MARNAVDGRPVEALAQAGGSAESPRASIGPSPGTKPAPASHQIGIAVLPGDGIGPDIVESTVRILDAAARRRGVELEFERLPVGLRAVETHRSTLPPETLARLRSYNGWILGPVSHHVYPRDDPRYINPSAYFRKHFELSANIRPVVSLPGIPSLHRDVDLVIVRENTEGFYPDRNVLDGNGEFRPNRDLVISLRVLSRAASTRVANHAFRLADARNGRRTVTAVHKANVLRMGDGLFLECCRRVAKRFPAVAMKDLHVDACAALLVLRPQEFDVIVTTNMFGDILSNEAASLVGGLGLAPGLNVGESHAMAQAAHGSAPDIEDLHVANPIAEVLSGKMLLSWLAERLDLPALDLAAGDIEQAIRRTLEDGRTLTPDLGGRASTATFTEAVLAAL